MDIKSLYAVVAIADYGSFREAANALGISLSGVSLQVSALEEEIGQLLFDRKTRPPTITEAGREYVKRARPLLAQWEALNGLSGGDEVRGALKIGAVHTTVVSAVPRALRKLQQREPELLVRLSTGLTHELEERVLQHQLDCAVITIPENISAELVCETITNQQLVVIAHKSARGNTVRQILEFNPYVRFNRQARVAAIIESELVNRDIAVNSRMEIDTLEAVVSLVENNLGVSIVPLSSVGRTLPASIRVVSLDSPRVTRKIGLIHRKDSTRAHLISCVVEEMKKIYD